MICKECGNQIPDGAVFCPNCGTAVEDDDLEATGLLMEDDDEEATGLLSEDDPPYTDSKPVQSYNPPVYNTPQNDPAPENVNPAYVNPAFNQPQQPQQPVNPQPNNYYQPPQTNTPIPVNSGVPTPQPQNQYNQQYANGTQNGYVQTQVENPSLGSCYKKFWKNYANFDGRSRRSDYWYVVLMNLIIALVNLIPYAGQGLYAVYALAIFIPSLAVIVRRLHDLGKEWYNIFFMLIPIAGPIIILVWMCTEGEPGPNKFGENPKGVNQVVNYQ